MNSREFQITLFENSSRRCEISGFPRFPDSQDFVPPKKRATPDKKVWEEDIQFENDQKSLEKKNRESLFTFKR